MLGAGANGDRTRLGDRLRELRQAHDLTLRQLAVEAGISAGMLSQLENGAAEPSLSTLRKLARVFDTSIATLFDDPDVPRVAVTTREHRMRLGAARQHLTYSRLTPGSGDLEVLEADIEPGQASSDEPYSHPSTECATVLAGELDVEVDGRVHHLREGDAITFDSRLPHRFVNSSDAPARLLVAVTPPMP